VSQIQVELQEWMGSDAAIANAAWTSTYDQVRREEKYDDPEKVRDIVLRCVRDGHSVPLESVVLRFWIRLPVFTDRQHMTHRMASHNGLSGRYRTLPSDFYHLPEDVAEIVGRVREGIAEGFAESCRAAYNDYAGWLDELRHAEKAGKITNAEYKRAREAVRTVLPTAFMVERTTIMNLLSFANYQRLRNSDHAQPEIREVAQRMLRAVIEAKVAPVALGALMDKGWQVGEPNHGWLEWEDRSPM
jgi:flavin-dependent thymidylate synthase